MIDANRSGLKGQPNLAQSIPVKPGGALGWGIENEIVRPARQGLSGGAIRYFEGLSSFRTKRSQMPEASNVYRKTDWGVGSTPPGSHVSDLNIFYKHANPPGLYGFTAIS